MRCGMIVSELSYIQFTREDIPRYTAVSKSHIIDGTLDIKANTKGYEDRYILNLAQSFAITYKGTNYYPTTNILAYHGKAILELFEGTNKQGKKFIRINRVIISNPDLIEFEIEAEDNDYTDYEREQIKLRNDLFG